MVEVTQMVLSQMELLVPYASSYLNFDHVGSGRNRLPLNTKYILFQQQFIRQGNPCRSNWFVFIYLIVKIWIYCSIKSVFCHIGRIKNNIFDAELK